MPLIMYQFSVFGLADIEQVVEFIAERLWGPPLVQLHAYSDLGGGCAGFGEECSGGARRKGE